MYIYIFLFSIEMLYLPSSDTVIPFSLTHAGTCYRDQPRIINPLFFIYCFTVGKFPLYNYIQIIKRKIRFFFLSRAVFQDEFPFFQPYF